MANYNKKPGWGGRPPGSKNRMPPEAKVAIAMAFQGLGGVPGLIAWAMKSEDNLTLFYTRIYVRIAPLTVVGDANNPLEIIQRVERVILNHVDDEAEERFEDSEREESPPDSDSSRLLTIDRISAV